MHDKFKAYWESIGKPPLEILFDGKWSDINWDPDFKAEKYRIKGDPHWELRRKWIESDFTLPIEYLDEDTWRPCDFTMSWDQSVKYREAVAGGAEKDPNGMNTPQPDPIHSEHPAAWSLVMRDMADRDIVGRERYGVRLQPHNGRDALVDAYQEILDAAVYLRQAIYERDAQ